MRQDLGKHGMPTGERKVPELSGFDQIPFKVRQSADFSSVIMHTLRDTVPQELMCYAPQYCCCSHFCFIMRARLLNLQQSPQAWVLSNHASLAHRHMISSRVSGNNSEPAV